MFTAALFVIARNWKQPKWPSTNEWLKKCGIFTQWGTNHHIKTKQDNSVGGKWSQGRKIFNYKQNMKSIATCYFMNSNLCL